MLAADLSDLDYFDYDYYHQALGAKRIEGAFIEGLDGLPHLIVIDDDILERSTHQAAILLAHELGHYLNHTNPYSATVYQGALETHYLKDLHQRLALACDTLDCTELSPRAEEQLQNEKQRLVYLTNRGEVIARLCEQYIIERLPGNKGDEQDWYWPANEFAGMEPFVRKLLSAAQTV